MNKTRYTGTLTGIVSGMIPVCDESLWRLIRSRELNSVLISRVWDSAGPAVVVYDEPVRLREA